jgi:hypothetical protein
MTALTEDRPLIRKLEGRPLVDYKITYEDGTGEEVHAGSINDNGPWMDFKDGGGIILRVLAERVTRVERV